MFALYYSLFTHCKTVNYYQNFSGTSHHTSGNDKFYWGPLYVTTEVCENMHDWRVFKPGGLGDKHSYPLKVKDFYIQMNMSLFLRFPQNRGKKISRKFNSLICRCMVAASYSSSYSRARAAAMRSRSLS